MFTKNFGLGDKIMKDYIFCKNLTKADVKEEIEDFSLSTLKLKFDEAVKEYEKRSETRLGRLVANRELPILKYAKEIIGENSCMI